jgi:hypothetical protein
VHEALIFTRRREWTNGAKFANMRATGTRFRIRP